LQERKAPPPREKGGANGADRYYTGSSGRGKALNRRKKSGKNSSVTGKNGGKARPRRELAWRKVRFDPFQTDTSGRDPDIPAVVRHKGKNKGPIIDPPSGNKLRRVATLINQVERRYLPKAVGGYSFFATSILKQNSTGDS